jgi:hypothetical protein
MTTSSIPDRGRALLMSTAAASFVLSAALVAGPANAAEECGPGPGTVTCPANQTFQNGITYPNQTADLTLVTQSTNTVNGPISVSGTGAVTVNNAASITTTAAKSPGIYALGNGAGNTSVTTTGTINTSGATSDGVDAIAAGAGNTTVTVGTVDTNGTVTGTGNINAAGTNSFGVAAVAVGPGTATATVNQGSTVSGALYGVAIGATPSTTVATEAVKNSGTITGGTASVYSFAGSGAVIVNNYATGTLNGPVLLRGAVPGGNVGNTVNNAGNWNVPGGSTSIFGPTDATTGAPLTNNVLNNYGGIITVVPSAPKAQPATANFAGLNTLNNAGGTIDLSSGNSLNIGNAQFNGGVGANNQQSTLRVSANSPSGVLTLGSTPNGTTRVVLADVPGTNPALNRQGSLLVTGPQNTSNGPAFGSFNFGAPGINNQHAGFIDYRLVFNAANQQQNTPSSYVLFGLPGPEVFEALNIPFALQDFWRHPAEAVTQRQMSIRDSMVGDKPSRAEGWEFWAIPYGGSDFFKRPQIFQFGNFFFPSVGNHNDTVGLQIGADNLSHFGSGTGSNIPGLGFLGIGGAGTGYWGFTGGVEQQTTHFPGDDANDIYSVGGNFGVYGGASWGGFYLNALGKVDFDDMGTNFFTAGFSPTNMQKAYGTRGEIGYRWPWAGFFVEPSARVNAIWTDGIDLNPAGALLRYNSGNASVDGEVGGRVGTTFNFGRFFPGPVSQFNPFPGQFNIFVGAWWADQWDGRNLQSFTTFGGPFGRTTFDIAQHTTGSFIHMEYGVETADWYGGLKMFLKGTNDFDGDSVGGWQAQMGVRFSF